MALLSEDKRIEIFKALNLGEYNKAGIKALQSKYLARKSDADGIYGTNTDNLLRHLYNCHKYLNPDNFKPEEFKCECGGKYCCGYPTYMKPAQLTNLQAIRNHYGKPMQITSGMRCRGWNSHCGGSISNSKHLLGQATDFYMAGVTDTLANRKAFIKYAKGLPNTTYIYCNGINIYGNSVSAPYMGNAIHYDTNDGNPTPVKDEVKGTSKLDVDGIGGKDTVKRMQEFFGTYVDGVITGQVKAQSKYYPSLKSVSFSGAKSTCIKNLQKWVGTTQDGILGQATVKAWQKKLGVTVDGIFGVNSMKAFQKYLNENDKPVYPNPKPPATSSGTTYIGQATKDYDKKAGDSTGKEVTKSKFSYSTSSTSVYNWTYVFRPKSTVKAEKAASMCEQAINNNCIGYNKKGETAYGKDKAMTKLAKAVDYDLSKITTKCGLSCGDLICLCNHWAGLSTCYIGSALPLANNLMKNSNFTCLSYKKGMALKRGDVLITAHSNGKNNHVAMVL